jgi:hypothetical protein
MAKLLRKINSLVNIPLQWEAEHPIHGDSSGWRHTSIVSVVISFGVLLISFACVLGKIGIENWSVLLFWVGLVLIVFLAAARFMSIDLSRTEAVGIIIVLGVGSFLVYYMRSPTIFKSFDEFLHWRTAYDILKNNHLFTPNALLPVSPLFPGLENVTAALVSLTGLSIIDAGAVVLLVSRVIMMLALFLFYEHIFRSFRAAGIAVLVYMGSSTFLYFDTPFAYESVALPLAIMCMWMLLYRGDEDRLGRLKWSLLIGLVSIAIVITHHVTAYMFTFLYIIWTCAYIYDRIVGNGKTTLVLDAAIWNFVLSIGWVILAAGETVPYLSDILNGSLNSIYELLIGNSRPRLLFVNSAGETAIIHERIFAFGSVLILGLGLMFGLWMWWLKFRKSGLETALMLIGIVYPALPLMRLSNGSWEMSNRLSGFVFFGLAWVVALAFVYFPVPLKVFKLKQWVAIIGLTIIFLGGVVAGSAPLQRLPQPYRPAAQELSIDNESVMAADWSRSRLGENNRMAADRTLTTLFGSYGIQRMVNNLSDQVSISGIFLNVNVGSDAIDLIKTTRLQYIVVDKRITQVLPTLGFYFESWEQLEVLFAQPVNITVLEKFDFDPSIGRIYDSGDIIIYDLKGILDASQAP